MRLVVKTSSTDKHIYILRSGFKILNCRSLCVTNEWCFSFGVCICCNRLHHVCVPEVDRQAMSSMGLLVCKKVYIRQLSLSENATT